MGKNQLILLQSTTPANNPELAWEVEYTEEKYFDLLGKNAEGVQKNKATDSLSHAIVKDPWGNTIHLVSFHD